MLTKQPNEMIGKRAKVKEGNALAGQIGTIDLITLNGYSGTVRLIFSHSVASLGLTEIEYCTCGDGDGCYLCADKPAVELPKNSAYGFPRRLCLYLMTPAELAIYNAVQVVEEVGADPLLTDAVVLLQQARDKVADYIDRKGAGQ